MKLEKTQVVGNKSVTIKVHSAENADVYYQVVNPRTNKGWQKHYSVGHFEGNLASMKALRAFNMTLKGN